MNLVKIKDNSYYNSDAFQEISSLFGKICDKTLGQLEKEGIFVYPELLADSDDVSKDQKIIQNTQPGYYSGNLMGFIGYGNDRLIIESRFSKGEDFFFQYLLETVLDFPNIINLETDANQEEKLFNYLLFLFPSCLKTALRKGIFKQYIQHEYNDPNLKGSLNVERHIKTNTPFVGKIAYKQREFSYDNYLTELVRHTIEYVKGKPYGNLILSKIKNEVKLIIESTPNYKLKDRQKVISLNKERTIAHAFYREYRTLQKLCILILSRQKHHIGFGAKQIYGILFDGSWLWEEYINTLIKNKFYHPMNKIRKESQWLFSGRIGQIYPDFISRDSTTRVIADAKYKPINNIGNKDYFQLLAYMLRFNANKGYFLYPETNSREDLVLELNEGSTYEQNVRGRGEFFLIKHGLEIPTEVLSYKDFVRLIKEKEDKFIKL